MLPSTTPWTRGLLIGLLLTVAGCGAVSESVEQLHEIRVPVNPGANDAPPIEVSGRTAGRCGGEGGCVYIGKLTGPVSEGFRYEVGWEFLQDEERRLTVPDDIEMPLAVPGTHVIQLYAQAPDVSVNEERQLEDVMARCGARFDVADGDTQVRIEVTFTFDAPGEGDCSIARLGEPVEPAFTSQPTPSS